MKRVILVIIAIALISGCINLTESFEKVPVVHVNVNVVMENNTTIIKEITGKGEDISKLQRPGMVIPKKFPAIYAEVLQQYKLSNSLISISLPNGIEYKGPGNYSFDVEVYNSSLNRSRPIYIYSEILMSSNKRVARKSVRIDNWTK